MLVLLIEALHSHFGITLPYVFSYYSSRMLLAAATSLLLCIFLGPLFIQKLYELKIGQTIRKEECPLLGRLHAKKSDTPTMGGLLILASMFISLLVYMDLRSPFTLILGVVTVALGALGGYDDYRKIKYKNTKGVSARVKLLVQGAVAIFVALYLLYPPFSQALHSGQWFNPPTVKEQPLVRVDFDPAYTSEESSQWASTQHTLPLSDLAARIYVPFVRAPIVSFAGWGMLIAGAFILFVIIGSSNAVNLTDGLDGLAAGCLILVASCLALLAFFSNHIDFARYLNILYIQGGGEIAIYLSALAGACLGFLWYNGHPAQVFMGDTGSLALGGIVGTSAVLLGRSFFLALVGGIFVAEAASVLLQVASFKMRNKRRIFLCAPLHHHFEYKGWPETKVVLRFWIIGLLLALIGMASVKFQ
jgi:phospho-N-acetylmuramoyl-pentapeptide-transferase